MKLSDTKIRALKPRAKPYKKYDQDGLYLIVTPDGAKWWRQRYKWAGKEQTLSLGTYPSIGLADARARRDELRSMVAKGVNPGEKRREEKTAQMSAAERSFKTIGGLWLEQTAAALGWTPEHQERIRRRREVHFDPRLGAKDVATIAEADVAACLSRIVDKGLFDTARRARSEIYQVFRFARARHLIQSNPVKELVDDPGMLPSPRVKHHASIKDPAKFGVLLRAIDAYPGGVVVQSALKILALTFVRPGELRQAKWEEFDTEGAEWRIPGERMKMREQHIVPLSRQAIAILEELRLVTGPDGHVFPQARNASRPLSENSLCVGLRVMGYTGEQMTAHGFRSSASTMLNELGFNGDHVEKQLAHGARDKVRAAYNSAKHLPERRKMMQAWADYLDTLRGGEAGKVVPLRAAHEAQASA